MAMMAMTTSNSIKVKPRRERRTTLVKGILDLLPALHWSRMQEGCCIRSTKRDVKDEVIVRCAWNACQGKTGAEFLPEDSEPPRHRDTEKARQCKAMKWHRLQPSGAGLLSVSVVRILSAKVTPT